MTEVSASLRSPAMASSTATSARVMATKAGSTAMINTQRTSTRPVMER